MTSNFRIMAIYRPRTRGLGRVGREPFLVALGRSPIDVLRGRLPEALQLFSARRLARIERIWLEHWAPSLDAEGRGTWELDQQLTLLWPGALVWRLIGKEIAYGRNKESRNNRRRIAAACGFRQVPGEPAGERFIRKRFAALEQKQVIDANIASFLERIRGVG